MRFTDSKAIKLVLDDRVTVTWQSDERREGYAVSASGIVDGDHGTYRVSYSPGSKVCTCPAGSNHRHCSHVTALELTVLREADANLSRHG